jgi:hypothetical protein
MGATAKWQDLRLDVSERMNGCGLCLTLDKAPARACQGHRSALTRALWPACMQFDALPFTGAPGQGSQQQEGRLNCVVPRAQVELLNHLAGISNLQRTPSRAST